MALRVLVTGGRNYRDFETVFQTLDAIHEKYGIDILMQGGAQGADFWAATWASHARDVPVQLRTYSAEWDVYGRAAGPLRNKMMLEDGKPDLVVAFPGGAGTANMVKLAQSAGVLVEKIGWPEVDRPESGKGRGSDRTQAVSEQDPQADAPDHEADLPLVRGSPR